MRCLHGALFGAALALVAAPADAQTDDAQTHDDTRARLHFEAASSHFNDGDYERALEEFRRSYELSGRPGLLFNIGVSLERLGQYAEAADHMERYLASGAEVPNREQLEARVQNLRRRAAERASEQAEPGEEADDGARPPTDLIYVGMAALIAAAAGGIAAGVLGGLALSEEDGAREGCFATLSCTPGDVQGIDDLALGADVAGTAAAVLAAAGVTFVALAHALRPSADSTEDGAADEAAFAPMVGPGLAGVSLRGSL